MPSWLSLKLPLYEFVRIGDFLSVNEVSWPIELRFGPLGKITKAMNLKMSFGCPMLTSFLKSLKRISIQDKHKPLISVVEEEIKNNKSSTPLASIKILAKI